MFALLLMAADLAESSGFLTGNALLQSCRANRRGCSIYIAGVSDAVNVMQAVYKKPNLFCPPVGTTLDQLTDAAVKFLEDRPELRAQGAAGLVGTSLIEAFPCPNA